MKEALTETQHIRQFFDNETRLKVCSINKIEQLAGMPRNTLSEFIRDKRDLAHHHVPNLVPVLREIGYKSLHK
jgi:hypothetical protein